MTDPILYQFPDPDKLTRRQQWTIILILEALFFDVPRRQVVRYIAEREFTSLHTIHKRLRRLGFDLKKIPPPEKPLSEKRQWEIDHPGMKRCTKCGQGKPATLEYFGPTKKSSIGLNSYCRDCERTYLRSRYHLTRENAAAWRKANPDKVKECVRQWQLKNPEKVRALTNRRRARKLQAEGSHTAADVRAQYKSQKGKCWYCGKRVGDKYHVDHRVPLSRGGSNDPSNLVIACPQCNQSKSDRLPHEWCGRLL